MTRYINILGSPHSGRTARALQVCSELIKEGLDVYYIKDVKREAKLFAPEITRKELAMGKLKAILELRGKVDVVVIDNPIWCDVVEDRMSKEPDVAFQKKLINSTKKLCNEYQFIDFISKRHAKDGVENALRYYLELEELMQENGIVFCHECNRLRRTAPQVDGDWTFTCLGCMKRMQERQRE